LQLPLLGEILIQCPSGENANKLHQKVKVVRHTVIGFRKMEYVHIAREIGNFVQKRYVMQLQKNSSSRRPRKTKSKR
jgi:hypothetical protein